MTTEEDPNRPSCAMRNEPDLSGVEVAELAPDSCFFIWMSTDQAVKRLPLGDPRVYP